MVSHQLLLRRILQISFFKQILLALFDVEELASADVDCDRSYRIAKFY